MWKTVSRCSRDFILYLQVKLDNLRAFSVLLFVNCLCLLFIFSIGILAFSSIFEITLQVREIIPLSVSDVAQTSTSLSLPVYQFDLVNDVLQKLKKFLYSIHLCCYCILIISQSLKSFLHILRIQIIKEFTHIFYQMFVHSITDPFGLYSGM